MQDTITSSHTRKPVDGGDAGARLNRLLAVNAQEAQRRSLFRNAQEEEQMLLMHRPLSTRTAYALFGMLLGTFPPAAIFIKMFGYGILGPHNGELLLLMLCLLMNIACAGVGYAMGGTLSPSVEMLERSSWHRMILTLPCIAMVWGAMTGGAGGLIFFGFGAVCGLICAIPVAVAAFLLFTTLHRLLVRGGMIDARHFWPLACGVTLSIAALIFGM